MDTTNQFERAFLFPGQGSQSPGMGKAMAADFSVARDVFAEADDVLGEKLSELCFEGPKEELALTANTQPALLACSTAALRVLTSETDLRCDVALGHSLGEFSALVAVGGLSFADALRLVRVRGRAMQEAVAPGVGAMAAIIGMPVDALEAACDAASTPEELVAPANLNGGGQIVVAGHAPAVERLVAAAKAERARAVPLKVSAPFHCALMAPAAAQLERALAGVEVGPMSAPVISNVEATPNDDPLRIKELLVRQVTSRVRWQASVELAVRAGCRNGYEIGHGRVLAGLIKRIAPELKVAAAGSPSDINVLKVGAE